MKRPWFSSGLFLIVFCCAYVLVFALDLPLFRYYPLHGEFTWGTRTISAVGPAMTWYGLVGSAAPIAALASIIIPDRAIQALRGYLWLFPVAAMLTCAYLLRVFFA